MKRLLPLALLLALQPLQAADVADYLPLPWMQALWGAEPYATVLKEGMPAPPTRRQVESLQPLVRLQHATAIKAVLLMRHLQRKADAGRMTSENNLRAAGYARTLECPQAFVDLLQRMGEGYLSGRQGYAADQAIICWAELYGIDMGPMGLMAQYADIPAEHQAEVIDWLPMPVMFNALPAGTPKKVYTPEEVQELISLFNGLAELYAGVQDAEGAETAARQAYERIARAQQTFLLVNQAEQTLPNELRDATTAYQEQRVRLIREKFYGCLRLRALDFLVY